MSVKVLDSPSDPIARKVSAIVEVITSQLGLRRPIAPADSFVDLGLTSMTLVDLMLAIEAEFDVTIPAHELTAENFQSIARLVQMLKRL